ncbi:MAG: DUF1549 and DUF1553 domain-containing protein [Bryobacteraceae bacterium]
MRILRRAPVGALLVVAGLSAFVLFASDKPKEFSPMQLRWWSLQPVEKPQVPEVKGREWVKNPIDAFVLAKLDAKGIAPNQQADKLTLIRRASLVMTGLPPSPEEVQSFLADDSPEAFERVVDRLLASPHYGERWARHWLDVARYADSEGFKADETRPNVWRYRDYVIESFNQDKPYDRFIREQIAGDELYPNDHSALIATGFNRHFPDESNARNLMQRRQELLNDVTDAVGSAFLGLTYGCARCHDHKFDPILHKDYYRLQAFFANTRIEDQLVLQTPAERAEWERRNAVWEEKTRDLRGEIEKLLAPVYAHLFQESMDKFPEEIQAAVLLSAEQRNPYQWQMYYKAKPQLTHPETAAAAKLKGENLERYRALKAELAKFDDIKPPEQPIAQTMIDSSAEAPKTHVLNGGAWDAPTVEVEPGFLTILDPAPAKIERPAGLNVTGRRTALANWLADPKNPLSTRVIVNRIWHYHFGRGIAGTPNDLGLMGERPTHRELLDWLTASFVENGWSMKKLHKAILLSATWQQSSDFNAEAAEADPENKLLWRYNRRRLEGEVIRDSMLAASGRLSRKMGGPGVFPPLPPGVVTRGGWKQNEDPEEANRRSVYVFVRRNTRYPMFEAFDMPDSHESCGRRNVTVTPSQSLELLNSELVLEWARAFAGRVLNDGGLSGEAQIDRVYKLAYSRAANEEERRLALEFLDRHSPILAARMANGESVPVPDALPEGADRVRAAALVDLCHAVLNSNEFLYIN